MLQVRCYRYFLLSSSKVYSSSILRSKVAIADGHITIYRRYLFVGRQQPIFCNHQRRILTPLIIKHRTFVSKIIATIQKDDFAESVGRFCFINWFGLWSIYAFYILVYIPYSERSVTTTTWNEFINVLLPSGKIKAIQYPMSASDEYVIVVFEPNAIIGGVQMPSIKRLPVANIAHFKRSLRAIEAANNIADIDRVRFCHPPTTGFSAKEYLLLVTTFLITFMMYYHGIGRTNNLRRMARQKSLLDQQMKTTK